MPLTSEILNLLNGVSQAPEHLRDPSQGTEQVNILDHRSRGKRVRPPTEHVAKLSSDTTGYDSATDFTLDRSATQRYRFIIANGDLKAFNIDTGASVPVYFPNGKTYLTGTGGFRTTQVGDRVVVLNRGVVTKKGTAKAPNVTPQALIQVKAADYETTYSVTLEGVVYSYKTPASSATNARTALGTDAIAAQLYSRVRGAAGFTVTQFGSVLHVEKADGSDFTISGTDGLGGIALQVIKGSVQLATDLPLKAKSGVVVEVAGSPESDVDNYFVQYDDSGSPEHAGVWKEVIKPGLLLGLDATTLPHVLDYQGYMFGEVAGQGKPKLPTISTGGATETGFGWEAFTPSADPILYPASDHSVTAHNTGFNIAAVTPTGANVTIRCRFDILCSTMDITETAEVWLTVNGVHVATAGGFAQPNGDLFNQTVEWTGAYGGGNVALTVHYLSGVTPTNPATLVGIGDNDRGPSVTVIGNLSSKLTFDTTYAYPAGLALTVTLNGTPFVYNVGAADQTGAQVATGLAALVNPDPGFDSSSPSGGVVLFITSGGAVPTTLVSSNFSEAVTFHAPSLAMTPGAQVGGTIKNLTDGSSATITANTGTTITVAALAGGADNLFEAGDTVGITATNDYFVFNPAVWADRAAGDDTSVPLPSFVDRSLDEVFFFQNRLGFTSRDSIVLSESGKYFNLFRLSAAQLLDSDVIDVRSAVRKVSSFSGAVEWTDGLYLASDQDVFRLSGNPALGPATVRLDFMGQYQNHPNVRPVSLPGHLALASVKNGATRIAFATIQPQVSNDSTLYFRDITEHVPTYIVGNPLAMVADPKAQMLLLITDGGARRSVYICLYDVGGDGRFTQLSWSRWDIAPGATIVGIDVLNGIVGLVGKRSDGAYLESITLDPQEVTPVYLGILDGAFRLDGSYYLNGEPV